MKSLPLSSFTTMLLLQLLILTLDLLPTVYCSSFSNSPRTAFHSKNHNRPSASATKASSLFQCPDDSTVVTDNKDSSCKKKYKLIQVQIIHRHGDRTPITPMMDRDYWQETLPSPDLLSKLSQGTRIVLGSERKKEEDDHGGVLSHAAGGIGPFGKLTKLGLLQMVQLGSRIRDELHHDVDDNDDDEDKEKDRVDDKMIARLFTHTDPIHPSKVKIKSTNFPRTIQSVQALLLGLFPLGYDGEIEIDASETDVLIPDPQPRLTVEQVELERELSRRSHIVEREEELEELAGKITDSLHHLIDWEHASGMSWGIGEEEEEEEEERHVNVDNKMNDNDDILNDSSSLTTTTTRSKRKWLTFSQLAEVMTCLRVRDQLPESISHEDYKIIASHSAWKWFENLRNDNLARLAMKSFMNLIMETLRDGLDENSKDPVLYFYSCHDSSLIGLMCAFRLEQPAEWPEYGSYLKVELFKSQEEEKDDGEVRVDYYVRFSLNGQVLKSSWGMEREGPTREMICLKHLSRSIAREHGHPCIIEERTGKNQT